MAAPEFQTRHDDLVAALVGMLDYCDTSDGWNLPEALSAALSEISAVHGSYRLIEHRPGCWEAEHVAALDMNRYS